MSSPPDPDVIARAALHLTAGKYFQLAAFVMLVYDHALTFPEEVERIWKSKFTGATVLFLINRYVTPLQFIIIIDAFHDPIWTKSLRIEVIVDLDVNALSRLRELLLLHLWLSANVTLSSIGVATGFAVPLPPGFVGCIFTGSNPLFPTIWVMPLITDTFIFTLTLWRTHTYFRGSSDTPVWRRRTIQVFIRDGLLYFLVIFMANLVNTLIFFIGEPDLKAVGASFSQLITATMISRLVLNLRSLAHRTEAETFESHDLPATTFMARTYGVFSEDLDDFPPERRGGIPLERMEFQSRGFMGNVPT
ncbi:hypothetical protein B0H34DRAFT_793228 [Crassisporium funariophilum]|nr:hypothetical protein B0H34DRAFT_793228 [Crassisporium funariophilum]